MFWGFSFKDHSFKDRFYICCFCGLSLRLIVKTILSDAMASVLFVNIRVLKNVD